MKSVLEDIAVAAVSLTVTVLALWQFFDVIWGVPQ